MSIFLSKNFLVPLNFILIIVADVALAGLPPIVVSMNPSANVTFYSRTLVPNPLNNSPQMFSPHLDKMDFYKLKVHKGQELQIDSLVLCENTLATIAGLTRGTDALPLGHIQSTIDTQDRKEFLHLVLEMARLRRHADSYEEWSKITKTVKNHRADWNAYLFKTDFVVVIAKQADSSGSDDNTRNKITETYFVPIEEIVSEAAEIDVYSAKLAILQSMSLKVLEGFQEIEEFKEADEVKVKLADLSKSLEKICQLENHEFKKDESPVGCLITDLGFLQCAGKGKKFSDTDTALLQLRKQIALLQFVRKYFPDLPGLEGLDALIKHDSLRVNCDNLDTLFLGLHEDISDGDSN